MDEDQVVTAQETPEAPEKKITKGGAFPGKKIFVIVGALVALLIIGGGGYFLGSRNEGSEEESVSVPFETPTSAPTPTPEETPSSTVSGTIAPTKKPTATPSLTPTPSPAIKIKITSSTAALDGFRSSNGGGNATLDIRAGRNVNLATRGFVSFDLSDFPAGANIKEATLRLYQVKTVGNPYGVGESIKVDHLIYGDSLDDPDYSAAALLSSFVTLTANDILEWKDADVTNAVKDDVANARSRSQYRIHFTTENTGGDVMGDFAYFEAADNSESTGNTPQLVVKYY